MPSSKKNIGESPEHLAMQLSTAVARVEMLARRLNPESNPHPLAGEIQAKLREYCRLAAPVPSEARAREPAVYQAKPVSVAASRVTGLGSHDANGGRAVTLDDGRGIRATRNDLARIDLNVGDYYVREEDGCVGFISAQEFQRKYSPPQREAA